MMAVKRYELSEAQWARIAPLLAILAAPERTTVVCERVFVGPAVGNALVRSARALRALEDGAQALQPLVLRPGVGAGVRGADCGP